MDRVENATANVLAFELGAALERETHEDTDYELSADQVGQIRERLAGWSFCPWCEADLLGSPTLDIPPTPHSPACLIADIVSQGKAAEEEK